MVITWGSEPNSRLEEVARTVIETPFTRRTWSDLLFMMAFSPRPGHLGWLLPLGA